MYIIMNRISDSKNSENDPFEYLRVLTRNP